jgi:hypothetical protein
MDKLGNIILRETEFQNSYLNISHTCTHVHTRLYIHTHIPIISPTDYQDTIKVANRVDPESSQPFLTTTVLGEGEE